MKITIDNMQGVPAAKVVDKHGVIQAKVYHCADGVVVSTEAGNYRVRKGSRTIASQVGEATEPESDGFVVPITAYEE